MAEQAGEQSPRGMQRLSELLRASGVEPLRWYGVWLFVDWLEFSGAELDPIDSKEVAAATAVELEASRRDPTSSSAASSTPWAAKDRPEVTRLVGICGPWAAMS